MARFTTASRQLASSGFVFYCECRKLLWVVKLPLPFAQLCREVGREAPTDEQVYSLLAMVLKRANAVGELTEIRASACAKHPQDAALLRGLFYCYTRHGALPPALLWQLNNSWHTCERAVLLVVRFRPCLA